MFYLFLHDYTPGEAALNRLIAYAKSLKAAGTVATLVFVYPGKGFTKVPRSIEGVPAVCCWSFILRRKIFKYPIIRRKVKTLIGGTSEGDSILLYGLQELLPLALERQSAGVKVFHERTEHPELFKIGGKLRDLGPEEYYGLCKKLDGLFVISRALKSFYIGKGVDESRISIINMIVDFSRFEGVEKNGKERYIAFCGNIASNDKDGVDRLLRAFAAVSPAFPDLRLHLAGKTSDEAAGNIALMRELGIEDKVKLAGFLMPEQIPQFLVNASIAALCRPDSLQAEYGFPTKLGEYLASGTPVVVSSVGDIPLFLRNAENAMVVAPDDISGMADAFSFLLRNPSKAAEIGAAGRKTALENFSSASQTQKITDCL